MMITQLVLPENLFFQRMILKQSQNQRSSSAMRKSSPPFKYDVVPPADMEIRRKLSDLAEFLLLFLTSGVLIVVCEAFVHKEGDFGLSDYKIRAA
uniref:Uncharacterized protein n=2 Tax=Cannabis sativa TaxID=3483 RepID=A0A803R8Z4_CANSA